MLSRWSFRMAAARAVASSVKGKPFRLKKRVAVMVDLHLDPVGQLPGFQGFWRWVAIDRVIAVDGGGVVVLGVDIADRTVPAELLVEITARRVGRLQCVAVTGLLGPDDSGDLLLGPSGGKPATGHAEGLVGVLVVDHPHAIAADVPMADLGGIEHPAFVPVERPAHEARAIRTERRLEIGVILGLGAAQHKAAGLQRRYACGGHVSNPPRQCGKGGDAQRGLCSGTGQNTTSDHFFLPKPLRPGGRPPPLPRPPMPPMPPGILPPMALAASSIALGSFMSGMPSLPNMPFMACFSMPPLPILPIFFIMSPIWRCILRSLLSSETSSPAPLAIRFLRLACNSLGLARSFLVIDWISAIWRASTLSSIPAVSICLAILPMPGIMPITPSMPPIFCICSSCIFRSFMLN